MKRLVRVLSVGLFGLLFTAAFAAPAFSQECEQEAKEAHYKKYTDNYGGTLEQRKVAVSAGKEYIKICKDSEPDVEIVKYLQGAVPELEKWIVTEEARLAKAARLNRFDKAYKAQNWAEVFPAGADILKYEPEFLDMRILLASAGSALAESNPPINTFNGTTLQYAQDSISRINAGETSTSKKWGGYNYSWGSKDNALGWLNYAIAYIKYYPQESRDEAMPYFYKAAQFNSDTKKFAPTYSTIGAWYSSKAAQLGKTRVGIIIDETAGENQAANIQKALDLLALEKGYVDRDIDAYARAFSLAKADKNATAVYRDGLFDKLKNLFAFRYSKVEEAEMRSEEQINSYVASISSNDLPNPQSEVKPVLEKIMEDAPTDKPADSSSDGEAAKKAASGGRDRTVGTTPAKKTNN